MKILKIFLSYFFVQNSKNQLSRSKSKKFSLIKKFLNLFLNNIGFWNSQKVQKWSSQGFCTLLIFCAKLEKSTFQTKIFSIGGLRPPHPPFGLKKKLSHQKTSKFFFVQNQKCAKPLRASILDFLRILKAYIVLNQI